MPQIDNGTRINWIRNFDSHRSYSVAFFCILFFSFLVRALPAIAQYSESVMYHQTDYNLIVQNIILRLTTGSIPDNYSTMSYPMLPQQIVIFVMAALHNLGHLLGLNLPYSDESVGLAFRLISVLFGTATVALTMMIAREITNSKQIALLAGVVISGTLLHITVSQEIKNDSLSTFFSLLTIYIALRTATIPKITYFISGGMAYGAAMACRESAIFLAFPLILALLLNKSEQLSSLGKKLRIVLAGVVVTTVTFLASDWHRVKNWNLYFSNNPLFNSVNAHLPFNNPGDYVPYQAPSGTGEWTLFWYTDFISTSGIGVLVFSALLFGVLIVFTQSSPAISKQNKLIFFSFPLIYLYSLINTTMWSDRYVMALTPFIAIFSAIGFNHISDILKSKFQKIFLLALVLIATAGKAILWDITFLGPSTREQTVEWLNANVPAGTGIVWNQMSEWEGPAWQELNSKYAIAKGDLLQTHTIHELQQLGYKYIITGENRVDDWLPQIEPKIQSNPHMRQFLDYYQTTYSEIIKLSRVLVYFSSPLYESGVFGSKWQGPGYYLFQLFQPQIVIRELSLSDGDSVVFNAEQLWKNNWFSKQHDDQIVSLNDTPLLKLGEMPDKNQVNSIYNGPYLPLPRGKYCVRFLLSMTPSGKEPSVRLGSARVDDAWVSSLDYDQSFLSAHSGKLIETAISFNWLPTTDMRFQSMIKSHNVQIFIHQISINLQNKSPCQS